MALLVMVAVVQLLAGVLAGLGHDWPKMSLLLFGCGLSVFFVTSALVAMKTDACFTQMEEHFRTNHKGVYPANRITENLVGAFMVLSVAVHIALSVLAGLREDGLRLGVHLTACAVTVVVCMGLLMALKIDARSKHVGRLISSGYEEKEGGGRHLTSAWDDWVQSSVV